MRLIGQKVDALAVLQLYKFSDERLLTGVSLNYRPRPEAVLAFGENSAKNCKVILTTDRPVRIKKS
mgnify:CR=1 FL=1